jgi:hypothetical protein
VEYAVIAHSPRNATQRCEKRRERRLGPPRPVPFESAIREPAKEKGKQRRKRCTGHQGDSPQKTVADPRPEPPAFGARPIGGDSRPQDHSGEKCRNRSVPHAGRRYLNRIRENGPEPRGSRSDPGARDRLACVIDGDACECRRQKVDEPGRDEGSKCVRPENAENAREDQRVDGRHPRRRSRIDAKRRTESVPDRDRVCDVPRFEQKRNRGKRLLGIVCCVIPEKRQPEDERHDEDKSE